MAPLRSGTGGETWQEVTEGLPDDAPVDSVREDLERPGLLYAGTETGVCVSFDDGAHWQSLQLDLPHSSMRDLWIHDDDQIVATHGRGFWILDDLAPLRQASAEVSNEAVHLVDPTPAGPDRRGPGPQSQARKARPADPRPRRLGARVLTSAGRADSGRRARRP